MQEFLHALLQFPSIMFAGMLGISLLYWVLVIVGAADLNPFDGGEGLTEGLHEGVADAAADAAAHVLGGGHDAVDATPLAEALAFLGLHKVPLTVSFSVFSLIGWFLAMVTRQGLDGVLPGPASAAAATAVAIVGGFAATSVVSRSLGGLFAADDKRVGSKVTLVGRVVKVTSELVDDQRGYGEIDDGAGGIAISIRTTPGVALKRGEEAIVLEHDDNAGTYMVEPHKAVVQTEEEQLAAPVEKVEQPEEVGSPTRR